MAPPRLSPRLADLDPDSVAAETVSRAVARVHSSLLRLDPDLILARLTPTYAVPARPDASCTLGQSAAQLVAYAQTGALGDWTDGADAHNACLDVLACVWPRAAGPLSARDEDLADGDDVAIAVLAAWARAAIDKGAAVTLRQLGALAGVGTRAMRSAVAKGELLATGGRPARVTSRDARRWLTSRGLAGFCRDKS